MSSPLPRPSRIVVNIGVIISGLIGLALSLLNNLDDTQAFILTGVCCLIGAAILSYGEVIFRRRRQSKQ